MEKVIHREKSLLQKIAKISAIISFILAFISVIILIIYGDVLGDVYKASTGAISFFCFASGIVLNTMGSANLPILKIPPTEKNK
jgi:ABC-type multidrug transport system fused ATPase/permease subunit